MARTAGRDRKFPTVSVTNPPYALATTAFRFAALAALAGRAPLGGQREVALAAYMAARLAQDVLPERGVPQTSRAERAAGAKNWLATLSLPAAVRPALSRARRTRPATDRTSTADALRAVAAATATFLDSRARSELDRLVDGARGRVASQALAGQRAKVLLTVATGPYYGP